MPTSVLLAVLAGAGLLALAPALVRRYDADERIAADREQSSARVLERPVKGRTGPGANPINRPSHSDESAESSESAGDDDTDPAADPRLTDRDIEAGGDNALHAETPHSEAGENPETGRRRRSWERSGARRGGSVTFTGTQPTADRREEATLASAQLRSWWQQRYRRVLYVLLGLNLLELLGVVIVGPGFWVGVVISVALLLVFLRFLRMRALRESSRRPRRPALASGRQVYVPPQPDNADPDPAEADYDDPADVVPGFEPDESVADDESDPEAAPEPPARRRTGGIRGRSYESPANL